MNKNILSLISILLFITVKTTSAQPDRPPEIDSVLYSYFMKCASKSKSYEVMALADTLFDLAGKQDNRRMQAAALSYKTAYYYYKGDKDSMLYYMKQCQDFSSRYGQLTHYYFVWTKLISYYSNRKQFNLALHEINKMLEQAKKDGYKEGIYRSYIATANIYFLQYMANIAIRYYKMAIEYMKENDIKDYNIHVLYTSLAKALVNEKRYDEALDVLHEAEKNLSNKRYLANIKHGYFSVYLDMGETEKARKYLDRIISMDEGDVAIKKTEILNAEKAYANATGDWKKVIELSDELVPIYRNAGIDSSVTIQDLRIKAKAYFNLGDTLKGVKCLQDFISRYIKNTEAETKSKLNEFSVMLEVDKLSAEKKELEINSQKEKIRYNRMLILVLSCLLILGLIFILFVSNLNRRLTKSNRTIEKKNHKLLVSQQELAAAKEKAEKANEVKTMFLQSITHEIRTPLNAIVGFSDLLASHIQDSDKEAKEYSDIIHQNSDLLLGLIDSVLYISDLEFSDITGVKVEMGVDICCLDCIERVRPSVKEGVEIVFTDKYDGGLVLNAYFGYISEVLVRLLDNAAKFTDQGRIELSYDMSQDDKFIVFSVTDTGMGIPEGIEEKIFDMFAKGNMFMPGIGLGLSITRVIAEKLGGSITLDREYKEKGSRFLFSVPID